MIVKIGSQISLNYNSKSVPSSDRHCGLVVRVPGYKTEMYCVYCEVRTEFIYFMYKNVDRLCDLVVRVLDYRHRGPGFDSRHYQKKK
jgi:hypothetical protein